MPVSFTVASHEATPVLRTNSVEQLGLTTRQILAQACSPQHAKAGRIRQTSLSGGRDDLWVAPTAAASPRSHTKTTLRRLSGLFTRKKNIENVLVKDVRPSPNGFVNTIVAAYSQHHNLILRPDDVWIAILTQFNFYINANAELLRANFVAHEGKIQLRIEADIFEGSDFGGLAREMVDLIHQNVVDPTLRPWVLPDFSTTTMNDTTVSSILMMATLKSYFEYFCDPVTCGIPRVTLEGEKRDWENILQRLEKLKEYGLETIAWYHLLVPVISRFVSAFNDPDGKSNIEFWQKVVNVDEGCNPPSDTTYSGWITAFCVFDDKGKWLGPHLRSVMESSISPDSLTAARFWRTYGVDPYPHGLAPGRDHGLVLDGTHFHRIHGELPPSYAEVDVMLYTDMGEDQECSMTAGAIGMQACSGKPTGQKDTVRPVIGWWLFDKK
ncbi:hypothetical protein B0H16DRAFT_1370536 [Mycena metata]|uniref:HECT domain-containing protein n=1 Tax=Mycena metata TaxID=1033252 RepID=A0AAD7J6Z6_9AGAR|nr:hypothetical protein B0H16DRAFT_1370536 [Mycena metata]